MRSKAKPLNDEIKRIFYPWVKSKGFQKQKSIDPHFVEFRRASSVGEDVFQIQWDKYWRPYFVVNFSKESTEDPRWLKGGRLQRKRGGAMSCWFSISRPLLHKLLSFRWSYDPQEVVQELQQAFGELEKWWEYGEIGEHMYFIQLHA